MKWSVPPHPLCSAWPKTALIKKSAKGSKNAAQVMQCQHGAPDLKSFPQPWAAREEVAFPHRRAPRDIHGERSGEKPSLAPPTPQVAVMPVGPGTREWAMLEALAGSRPPRASTPHGAEEPPAEPSQLAESCRAQVFFGVGGRFELLSFSRCRDIILSAGTVSKEDLSGWSESLIKAF